MDFAEKRTVVVAMPFDPKFDVIYHKGIRPAIKKCGLESVRLDEKYFTGSMIDRLLQEISRSAAVIGEVTDQNPNVMYEIGYADALRKPTLLVIRDSTRDVPFDIRDRKHLRYRDERDLPRKLERLLLVALSEADGHWEAFRASYDRVSSLSGALAPFLLPIAQRYLELWRRDVEAIGIGSAEMMPSGERLLITKQLIDTYKTFESVQCFPPGDPLKIYTPNWLRFNEELAKRKDVTKRWILMTPRSSWPLSRLGIQQLHSYFRQRGFKVSAVDPATVEKALNRALPSHNAFERIGPVVKYLKIDRTFHSGKTTRPLETVLRIANHDDLQLWEVINANAEPL